MKTSEVQKSEVVFDYKTIKSYEDASVKENVDPSVLDYLLSMPENEFKKAIINGYKLYVIYKAINNGWVPDWSDDDQYKYFPWFKVLSSGFGFSGSTYHYRFTGTSVGSRLCTDSEEKALYIAETFGAEYKEFLLYPEE